MRSSDWSSEVCSSDLYRRGGEGVDFYNPSALPVYLPELEHASGAGLDTRAAPDAFGVAHREALVREEIGSASCRARVVQYVYISVVAVSLKTKIILFKRTTYS